MSEIIVDNVTKTYGSVQALQGISLTIPSQSSFGLLGTNGAGKTTLLKLLIGHERPDSGYLEIAGLSPDDGVSVRQRVGYVPEKASFPARFSGREVLEFHADIRNVAAAKRDTRIGRALERVGLSEDADRGVGGYSKGMNRRLGLATVLVADPDVLLLDEPTSGLDSEGVDAFHSIIENFSTETDVTVVLSSHALNEIKRMCDQIAVLHEGHLKVTGNVDELRLSVSDKVFVDIWLNTDFSAEDVLDEFNQSNSVQINKQTDHKLKLTCDRNQTMNVLESAQARGAVERFEVRQPGIEAVFQQATNPD